MNLIQYELDHLTVKVSKNYTNSHEEKVRSGLDSGSDLAKKFRIRIHNARQEKKLRRTDTGTYKCIAIIGATFHRQLRW
jgi:hypothetical protein